MLLQKLALGRSVCLALLAAAFGVSGAHAQARGETGPVDDYLVRVTQEWARESVLGDARDIRLDADDVELRVWAGYGLRPTVGIVMRRVHGAWRGWSATTHQCTLTVPLAIRDTASEATTAALRARTRRECGRHGSDTSSGWFISVDTVETREIRDARGIARAWNAAVKGGVLDLPLKLDQQPVIDGTANVIELRRGERYEAITLQRDDPTKTDGERRVRAVYEAVRPLLQAWLPRQRGARDHLTT